MQLLSSEIVDTVLKFASVEAAIALGNEYMKHKKLRCKTYSACASNLNHAQWLHKYEVGGPWREISFARWCISGNPSGALVLHEQDPSLPVKPYLTSILCHIRSYHLQGKEIPQDFYHLIARANVDQLSYTTTRAGFMCRDIRAIGMLFPRDVLDPPPESEDPGFLYRLICYALSSGCTASEEDDLLYLIKNIPKYPWPCSELAMFAVDANFHKAISFLRHQKGYLIRGYDIMSAIDNDNIDMVYTLLHLSHFTKVCCSFACQAEDLERSDLFSGQKNDHVYV